MQGAAAAQTPAAHEARNARVAVRKTRARQGPTLPRTMLPGELADRAGSSARGDIPCARAGMRGAQGSQGGAVMLSTPRRTAGGAASCQVRGLRAGGSRLRLPPDAKRLPWRVGSWGAGALAAALERTGRGRGGVEQRQRRAAVALTAREAARADRGSAAVI
ncbi:hypothetical protein FA09DRAFT_1323 [Tilletiopsis washingtonensis]|uniref:Uncharacterized protein n=1 Tax=Tilletiopsis washingtonensis TaxID=58919 RepID=A0A316ZHT5_9BASI|nr:hypothetical protein FA09DRAFT_1323 [Tilletiopsis washingtonensis]PWO01072.1 hypothetical protein FA09DRAFT_1323 [Tilletiopsis washingtonensis]